MFFFLGCAKHIPWKHYLKDCYQKNPPFQTFKLGILFKRRTNIGYRFPKSPWSYNLLPWSQFSWNSLKLKCIINLLNLMFLQVYTHLHCNFCIWQLRLRISARLNHREQPDNNVYHPQTQINCLAQMHLASKQEGADTKMFLCIAFASSLGFHSVNIITVML